MIGQSVRPAHTSKQPSQATWPHTTAVPAPHPCPAAHLVLELACLVLSLGCLPPGFLKGGLQAGGVGTHAPPDESLQILEAA